MQSFTVVLLPPSSSRATNGAAAWYLFGRTVNSNHAVLARRTSFLRLVELLTTMFGNPWEENRDAASASLFQLTQSWSLVPQRTSRKQVEVHPSDGAVGHGAPPRNRQQGTIAAHNATLPPAAAALGAGGTGTSVHSGSSSGADESSSAGADEADESSLSDEEDSSQERGPSGVQGASRCTLAGRSGKGCDTSSADTKCCVCQIQLHRCCAYTGTKNDIKFSTVCAVCGGEVLVDACRTADVHLDSYAHAATYAKTKRATCKDLPDKECAFRMRHAETTRLLVSLLLSATEKRNKREYSRLRNLVCDNDAELGSQLAAVQQAKLAAVALQTQDSLPVRNWNTMANNLVDRLLVDAAVPAASIRQEISGEHSAARVACLLQTHCCSHRSRETHTAQASPSIGRHQRRVRRVWTAATDMRRSYR